MIANVWRPWCLDHQRRALAADRDAQRARAEAAEADVARLRADRDRVDLAAHSLTLACDAARADAAALRAIVEGRTVPPTDAEIAAHAAAGGVWLVAMSPGFGHDIVGRARALQLAETSRLPRRAYIVTVERWWALDAAGRPCPWPTVTP